MAGTTFSKFFWQDWQADAKLKLCSMGAQGWWMRLLCIAAEAEPTGHVLVNGKRPTPEQLRQLTGCLDTDETIKGWMDELVQTGVADRTAGGVLVSRRQVRDKRRREVASSGGKARGRAENANTPETPQQNEVSRGATGLPPSTTSQNPPAISHSPATVEGNAGKVARVIEALGFDPTKRSRSGPLKFIESLVRLEQDGFDLDLDILPAIRTVRETGRIPGDLESLAYFRRPIEAGRQARLMGAELTRQRNEQVRLQLEITPEATWRAALERFLRDGVWKSALLGPPPTLQGCLCPPAILDGARASWDEQGRHPREDLLDDGAPWKRGCAAFPEPLPFWTDNVVTMPRRAAP